MSKELIVFHPSPNLVATVDRLIKKEAPNFVYRNIVHEDLLDRAILDGITDEIEAEITAVIEEIPEDDTHVILCTCSTLGGIAERIGAKKNRTVIRIDRAMAELAIKYGRRIAVAAALESTIEPTSRLLKSIASEKGVEIDIGIISCHEAWAYKQSNDNERYIECVASKVRDEAERFDVIVLAQGSMAPACKRLSDLTTPVLCSPELGVQAALKLCKF